MEKEKDENNEVKKLKNLNENPRNRAKKKGINIVEWLGITKQRVKKKKNEKFKKEMKEIRTERI